MQVKKCPICKSEFVRKYKESRSTWERKKFCSVKCKNLSQTGTSHPLWKGDKVGYYALHAWVKRHLPRTPVCEICRRSAAYDLANISQEYRRDLLDWQWLCRRCHMEADGRKRNLLRGPSSKIKRGKDGRFYAYNLR